MNKITEKQFIKCLNHIASMDEGKVVIACLKEYCCFDGDIIREGNLENTYANAAIRRVYLWLRSHIDKEALKEIEYNYQREKEVINDRTSTTRAKLAESINNGGNVQGRKPTKPRE